MQERWKLTAWLACIWFISLLYGEYIAFVLPSFMCSWPPIASNVTEAEKESVTPVRVALIADPQLADWTTHGLQPGSLALRLTELYADVYMIRAFRSSLLPLNPDQIIFLGDYFNGGSELSDYEWKNSLKRFRHIFDQSHVRSTLRHASVPVHYIPGNHDLGYVHTHWQVPLVLERYKSAFGGTINFTAKVGGVEFIFINAQILDGPDTDSQTRKAWSFIQQLSQVRNPPPRVLLSHIPLYRPDDTPCGSHRTSSVINQRVAKIVQFPLRIVYQNYLTEETSKKLLDLLKPVAVFSGHDHDQCETIHTASGSSVVEQTVGTFSWQNGNIFPSVMLLSVEPDSSSNGSMLKAPVASSLCFLPVQIFIYVWYAILAVASVVAIFSWPAQGVSLGISWHQCRSYIQGVLSLRGGVKEKNEDLDTEWDMVWDAEGGMHLISKGYSKTPDTAQGSSSDIRGTAQTRPAAKRAAALDLDSRKPPSPEDQSPVAAKPSRSKGRSCAIKLLRGFGPLIALIAWSFGLYVILLMKDWSETQGDLDYE